MGLQGVALSMAALAEIGSQTHQCRQRAFSRGTWRVPSCGREMRQSGTFTFAEEAVGFSRDETAMFRR